MNHSRAAALLSGVTSMAQKVFESVPIQEAWTHTAITADLNRGGMAYDAHKVRGCLRVLVDAGLVKTNPQGLYQRVKIRETVHMPRDNEAKQSPLSSDSTATPPRGILQPVNTKDSIVDELAQISAGLRAQGAILLASADKLDAAALDLAAEAENITDEMRKLRTLKDALAALK